MTGTILSSLDIDDEYTPTIGVCKYGEHRDEIIINEAAFGIEVKPIPLTPEWLERCGFVKAKEEDSNSYMSYSILKLDGVIAKQEDGWYQMITDIDGYHEQNVGVKLEFVHQLQNRYQSLTGEELNVKP